VGKTNPSQTIERHDAGDRLTDGREQLAPTGVEEERLVVVDEDLVEGETAWQLANRGADAIDASPISLITVMYASSQRISVPGRWPVTANPRNRTSAS